MRSKIVFLSILLASSLPITTASANWQYTKWDMSIDEIQKSVKKATKNTATEFSGTDTKTWRGELRPLLGTKYNSGHFSFNVDFLFNWGKQLKMVVLTPSAYSQCQPLGESLMSKYGKPDVDRSSGSGASYDWHDEKGGNVVTYYDIQGISHCEVIYQPLDTVGARGL